MTEALYPTPTRALAQRRSALAPKIEAAFQQFSQAVFQDGALPRKSKQLIAVAVTRDAVPILHSGSHQGGHPGGRDA
jgi:hypothetical protein